MNTKIETPCKYCKEIGCSREQCTTKGKIPAEFFDGSNLRMNGMGEAGMNGGPSGDLSIAIYAAEDKHFERNEDD
jgi:molecular chaperone DnaJ